MSLLSLVRRSIRLAVLKMMMPLDDVIEGQRCSSWNDLKTHYPHVSVGQLERVINTGAIAMLCRLVIPLVSAPAANDTRKVAS